ncbi:helix-turn-helix domain-containing protein [Kutzneria albida]|uniref:HTH cro/C1-type domain-containing protein n=1 Tax=Kutzneria albida DSM 43870 TaxID=1449976 RepID=W5WBH6_9PSEU|nr:helix-turn-helix transcriptional regulator [Kutzneria albida]AHH98207.1 hypothetical protein KALB_4845 [Kutzneria albida DSM 43870]
MTQEPTFKPAELAKLVRDARLKLGLSMVQVARAIRLSDRWLGLLEAGDRPDARPRQPKPENIRALALVLRLDEEQALTLAGYSADVPVAALGGRPSCSEALFNANVKRLSPPLRSLFMELAAVLAEQDTTNDSPNGRAA